MTATSALGLAPTGIRLMVLGMIARYKPMDVPNPESWCVYAIDGYERYSLVGTLVDARSGFTKRVTVQCEAMAAAGWIVEGERFKPGTRRTERPWLITGAGASVLAAASAAGTAKCPTVRLSDAQRTRIERAHLCGGEWPICDQSWAGEVDERHSMHAMVRAGLIERVGTSPDDSTMTVFRLTDDGRRAYATDGRIVRNHRCDHPICCGTWPEETDAPPTHGSCPACSRWIGVTKTGTTKRHTILPKHICPGVGQMREGA